MKDIHQMLSIFSTFAFHLEHVGYMQRSQSVLARLAPTGRRQGTGELGPHATVSIGELKVADGHPPGEGAACPLKEQTQWCGYMGMQGLGNALSHPLLQKDSLSPASASSKAGGRPRGKGSREYEQILHWPFSRLRQVFNPTIVLRANRWGSNTSDWYSACLPGWDGCHKISGYRILQSISFGNPVCMGKEYQHTPGYAFKLLWLSWYNNSLHRTNMFKLLWVFFPPFYLFCHFLQETWTNPGKPLLMFQVEHSLAGHCTVTPRETFPMKVCSVPAADLPGWANSVSGSCTGHVLSLPVRGCEMKGEEVSEGILRWVKCAEDLGLLMYLVAHTVVQETELPSSHKVGWLLKAFFPLLHGNRIETCPLEVEENTSHFSSSLFLCCSSQAWSLTVRGNEPLPNCLGEHLWIVSSGLLGKGRALAVVVPIVSTLFHTERSDCYSEEY